MKLILSVFIMVLALATGISNAARADYFVWQDPQSGVSLSFPDSWQMVNNVKPDDVLTIMAPSGRAHAACRMRVNDDRRYLIYPQDHRDSVQRVDFSYDFWDNYLLQFNQGRVHEVRNGAGLGRGFASYALMGYQSAVPGPRMNRTALAFVSLYNDKAYVLECSAHRDAFSDWQELFMSIAASVDFDKIYHEVPSGNYRNFMKDGRLHMPDAKGVRIVEY